MLEAPPSPGRQREGYHQSRPPRTGLEALTPREREILVLLAKLGTQRMVARELGISWSTVKNHLVNAREKLGVDTAIQACVAYDRLLRGQDAELD
jgi:two-component system, NarL family, nitrate/nitrite response regulator NarL